MKTDEEQLMIELINRARANPTAEAALHGIDLNEGLAAGTISTAAKQPLAPHQSLTDAAGDHADDMLARDYFSHTTLGTNEDPDDRAMAAGYPGGAGENISWGGSTGPIDELAHVYDFAHDTVADGVHSGSDNLGADNSERVAMGLPIDHDGNPRTPRQVDPRHPYDYTENALRDEIGAPRSPQY